MAQTLLQIAQQASREMGITAPATIISNTDLYAVTLLNLLNGIGQDLSREHEWQGLSREHSFSTEFFNYTGTSTTGSTSLTDMSSIVGLDTTFMVDGAGVPNDTFVVTATGVTVGMSREALSSNVTATYTFSKVIYSFPSGFDRLRDDTDWDKSNFWPMVGPLSAQQWQYLKGSNVASTIPRIAFRQLADKFQIFPPTGDERVIRFEYLSSFWGATSASATPTLSTLTADTDTNIFPDSLMRETLKMRWRMQAGTSLQIYKPQDITSGYPSRMLDIAKANDAGSPSLAQYRRHRSYLLGWGNMPDGNFPS